MALPLTHEYDFSASRGGFGQRTMEKHLKHSEPGPRLS